MSLWFFLVMRMPGSDLEPNGSLPQNRTDQS
jgi:hypothetical protein